MIEAAGYGQWVAINFFAVPAMMLAMMLVVLDIGAVIGYFMLRKRNAPSAMVGRIVLLLTLNVAMGFCLQSLMPIVAWAKLVTVGNALFVMLPAIFVALLIHTLFRSTLK